MKLISFPSLDDWWTLTPSDQHAESVQWQNRLQFVSFVKSVMKHMKHLKYFQSNHIHRHIACRPITVAVSRTSVHETWCHPQQQLLISRPAASTCSTTEPRSKLQTWNRVLKEEMSSKLKRRSVIGLDQQNHHLLCSSVELLATFSFWFWFCRTSYT